MHRKEELALVFLLDAVGAETVLRGIQSVVPWHEAICAGFELYGKQMGNLSAVATRLKKMNRGTFHLVGCGYEFDFGKVTNHVLDFLVINEAAIEDLGYKEPPSWDEWACPFITMPGFVMGWIADSEYQHWQNAYDPLQYKAVGRDFSHLPMKSNGLPYPLEQSIIDTSRNPGRSVIRKGYYEVVGSVMWLGEPFWGLAGVDHAAVQRADWISKYSPTQSVVRLQVADETFTDDTGSSGALQRRLRALLFPGSDPA